MIKVQLDGKALAELIGGDSEVEMELRNGVVQEFTRKYLKTLITKEMLQVALDRFFREEVGSDGSFYTQPRISKKMVERISEEAKKVVENAVHGQSEKMSQFVFDEIEKARKALIGHVSVMVAEQIPKALNAEIERRVSERLRAIANIAKDE